ncbi:MAG: diguanylate cyclase [Proteobacteria bacterium]|nr:diguanylate cyclase [Pseudomonadota bacterium]
MFDQEADLEKIADAAPVQVDDAAGLLAQAPKYGIDLDMLENPQGISLVREENVSFEKNDKPFWHNLDVKLGDLLNPLLNDSERPMVLVSDDRIVYCNQAIMQTLDIKNSKAMIGEPFLSFVDREDWNVLTTNIGEMLTSFKKQRIRLKTAAGKVVPIEFQAIYLPDSTHFSFILVGGHVSKANKPFFNNLYDDLTGLPNFFLFEDRVQMAVNNENYKDARLPKDLIAVMAVSIENMESFRKMHLENFVYKKLANTLVLSLKKNYTVARGLKYPLWILMPDLANGYELDLELKKLRSLFKEGVSDNFTTHELHVNIGVSVFPNPARSAKKLVEQAIAALKAAQEREGSSIELFGK